MLDVQAIRKDFPILDHKIYDKPLIYFDNGATTQKPRCVVEKIESGYYNVNANIHRGVHFLSQAATEAHEDTEECGLGDAAGDGGDDVTQSKTLLVGVPHLEEGTEGAAPDSGHQPDCFQLYRRMYVGRRRSDRFGDGTPFQYRSLADTGCP